MPNDKPVKLEPRQEIFVKEFLVDLNATQAAIRAGYSKKTSRQIGAENLSKLVIQEAIKQAMTARVTKLDITADRVIKKIATIAFGKKKDRKERDRLKALELLGKHFVLFTDKIDLHDKTGVADKLARARRRREGKR